MKNNVWKLVLYFFILPVLLTILIIYGFSGILEFELTKKILSVSGYLFTLSSLILVFILYQSFKPSDYHKSIRDQKYLDKEGIEELGLSLVNIKVCIINGKVEGLAENSSTVVHIHRSLKKHEEDAILKAYSNYIKKLFNLINTHGLISIGLNKDYKKMSGISRKNKLKIWEAADELERYVKQMK